ncbi:methionyl-tRNA formyltransferase, partial [Candidatus Wolfebacteria bacterium]|nr:methionyl-tRNA formyltransferase [Candidatus Wolfebacteria bacterium]
MDIKYVFFGTPEFSATILEKLIKAGFIPSAVVCNPDKPVGRKQILTAPAAKIVMSNKKLEIRVMQPEKLDSSFISRLSSLESDFFVVASYAKIIPKEILEIPKLGSIGVHPSLLPKHRGASPIQTTILNGDEKTGVSLFLMDEKTDHGPVLATSHLPLVNSENYETLMRKLAELGGDLLVEILPKFATDEIKPQIQDKSQATFTKKFRTEDGFIESAGLEKALNKGGEIAVQIERKVR